MDITVLLTITIMLLLLIMQALAQRKVNQQATQIELLRTSIVELSEGTAILANANKELVNQMRIIAEDLNVVAQEVDRHRILLDDLDDLFKSPEEIEKLNA